jgi:Possible tRNA binding domain
VPLEQNLDDEMEEAGNEVVSALKEKQRELINSLDLSKYRLLLIIVTIDMLLVEMTMIGLLHCLRKEKLRIPEW